jgi:hypothetical protein
MTTKLYILTIAFLIGILLAELVVMATYKTEPTLPTNCYIEQDIADNGELINIEVCSYKQ